LRDWVREKRYLRAIVTQTYIPRTRDTAELSPERYPVNESEDMYMIPRIRKIYICPRGIIVHRGDPSRCGAACKRAQGDDDIEYEEQNYVEVVTVKKEIEFIGTICRAD
jgi:hypothetical protein